MLICMNFSVILRSYLTRYLIVTGVLAALVVAFPLLVPLGVASGIIPGLVFAAAPTAFLWGCIFALFWLPARAAINRNIAGAFALIATSATVWLVPTAWRHQDQARLQRDVLSDVNPPKRFSPRGHVRMEGDFEAPPKENQAQLGEIQPYRCDNVCLALLFEPGVESVTVGTSADLTLGQIRDGETRNDLAMRTYRLVPKRQCVSAEISPDLDGRVGLLGDSLQTNEAIEANWKFRLSSDVCLIDGPPRQAYDLLIRWGRWSDAVADAPKPDPWSFTALPVTAEYSEVRSRTFGLLAREWKIRVSALARPLRIALFFRSPYIGSAGWARTVLHNGLRYEQPPDIVGLLKKHSTMLRFPDQATFARSLFFDLSAAQGSRDVTADDPVWALLPAWLTAIAATDVDDADRDLIYRLITDRRVTSFDNLHKLQPFFADDSREIRAAIVGRLLADRRLADRPDVNLNRFLFNLPEGSFASLTPAEQELLAASAGRISATGIIARLGDRGSAAAPQLAEFIKYHALASIDRRDQAVIAAAEIALCRLGPAAAPVLPQLQAIEANGLIRDDKLPDWHRMLARVGAPVGSIAKPASVAGAEVNYRRDLRNYLDRFDPKQCGRI